MVKPIRRLGGAAVRLVLGLFILRGLSQVKLNFNAVDEGVVTGDHVRSDVIVPPTQLVETTTTEKEANATVNNSKAFISNATENRDAAGGLLLRPGDSIYDYDAGKWDAAPIVLESHRLLFFTQAKVGCTVWKQLFRRMMGASNWQVEGNAARLPWNPKRNGLKYLYNYNLTTANHMLTSSDWTRAIFVREPKERFLSAYLDKAVGHPEYFQRMCCQYTGDCVPKAQASLTGFFEAVQTCPVQDAHWSPQHRRMEARYWPTITFVGHMETAASDAERLLRQIGAWDDHGAHGWGGANGTIFGSSSSSGRSHATNAKDRLRQYYTHELEQRVDGYNRGDYENTVLNLTRIHIFSE